MTSRRLVGLSGLALAAADRSHGRQAPLLDLWRLSTPHKTVSRGGSGPAGRREREKNAVERASIAADRGEDGGTFHPGHHDNIRASSAISTAQGEVRQAAAWRRPAVPGRERRGHLPCTMEKEMF